MTPDLLTIGEFARASWLSIKALRLYDEQGLLAPAHVDPYTGYRYYLPGQARAARAIAILRQLDMPLSEIREIMTGDDAKVRAHLDAHRTLLADRIRHDEQLLERVENFIRKGAVMTYDISLTDIEPTTVVGITLDTTPEAIGENAGPAYARLADVLPSLGIPTTGDPRMVYHSIGGDTWTIECCLPVDSASSGLAGLPDDLTLRSFPGVRAAHTEHVGPYDELGIAYQEVGAWMGRNGFDVSDDCPQFDVYLNDCNALPPSEWKTELVVPVREA